ncbi:arylamine N-acetyltransferase [Pseudonocardia sp.]|uniref:arylamine N-acetyltransferase family protein n=1 Tax=Pseudonocardia sp. TaxID=60912 RepID=UPI00260E2B4A|nr:arylamine N-acetyltransferase [Pseudonocardia sp.]
MDVDLPAYLDRIGVPAGPPDLATLGAVVSGHTRSIPFENLDPFTGREVGLDPASLDAKLVRGGRGGYCFEHNRLLLGALGALGYTAVALLARVVWGRPVDTPPTPLSHLLLRVELPHGPHVVDVGFGGNTLTGVLALAPGVAQETPHETYRLRPDGGDLVMQVSIGGAWRSMYRFDPDGVHHPIDHEVASFYVSHHPDSHFVTGLTAARVDADRRHALGDARYTVHHLGGPSEIVDLGSVREVRDALERHLHVDTSGLPDLDTHLARLF